MQHLLPFYLFFCISAGLVSAVVLFLVRRVSGYKPLSWFLVFLVSMGINITANLSQLYNSLNLAATFSVFDYAMLLVLAPFSVLQFLAGPLFFHAFYALPWKKAGDRVVIGISLATLLAVYSPWYAHYDFPLQQLVFGPAFLPVQIVSLLLIAYALTLGLVFVKRQADPSQRKMVWQVFVLSVVFIPGFVHDLLYFTGVQGLDQYPVTLIYHPLYYMILSLGAAWQGARWLLKRSVAAQAPAESPLPPGLIPLDPGRLSRLGLSERETELLPSVVEGLGNKQIAFRFGLSTKTVNNHLYNIYQKLKVSSRWELLALLQRQDDV